MAVNSLKVTQRISGETSPGPLTPWAVLFTLRDYRTIQWCPETNNTTKSLRNLRNMGSEGKGFWYSVT